MIYKEFHNYLERFENGDMSCYQDCIKELATLCEYGDIHIPSLWHETVSSILNSMKIKVEYDLKQAVSNWLYASALWNVETHTSLAERGACPYPETGEYYDFGYSREYDQFNFLDQNCLKKYIQTIAMFETLRYYLATYIVSYDMHHKDKKRCFGEHEVWEMIAMKHPVEIDWRFYDIIVNGNDFSYDTTRQTELLDDYLNRKQYRLIQPDGSRCLLHPYKFIPGSKKDEHGIVYTCDGRYLVAFKNKELTEYRIKDGTCLIGNFADNTRLERLTIPSSVVVIGDLSFCKQLHTVHIEGNNLEIISDFTFSDCQNLSEINLPESITCIDEGAFGGCCIPVFHIGKNILSLTGGSDVTPPPELPLYYFGNEDTYCIEVDENNPNYCSIDGMLYSKDRKILYFCPEGKLQKENTDTLYIPEGTEVLYKSCMEDLPGLKKIYLPSTIRILGECCFPKNKMEAVFCAPAHPIVEGTVNYKNLTVRVADELVDTYKTLADRFRFILGLEEPDPHLSAILMWQNGLGNMNMLFDGKSPLPKKTETATADHKDLLPMPDEHITMRDLSIELSADDMEIIRKGHIPNCMEDHWFMYCDDEKIRYYRSWTGKPVFEARYEKRGDSYHITELIANGSPEYFVSAETESYYHLFLYLLYTEAGHDSTRHWNNFVRYLTK